ncbi:MAG: LacI family DNA-binding transcriptional regulator [Paludibacter sp.]|nr:LacI family DNA-binding transcriptional regulator [Paludibacter sp.]
MKKRITIKDIAKVLNVHHSTVSRALRNDPRVNAKTRDTVLAYAREHEYQTNMNAVQLRGTSNNAIALIVPNINHSFFADIISQLTNLAYNKGYVISVFQSNEKYQQEKEIVNTIIQHNFAGVIVSIAKDTINSDHFALLKKFGIPLVFFDRVCEDIFTPKVKVNNYEITANATEYLIKKGYSNIAHFTGTTSINVFRERQNGYVDILQKYGMEYVQPIVIEEDFSVEIGKIIFSRLWNFSVKPDAIISSSVHVSTGILLEARKYGIKIPEDLGLITFGSLLSSEIIEPQITYIEQPELEIAAIAFDLLEKMIKKEIQIGELIERQVQAEIIFKKSC